MTNEIVRYTPPENTMDIREVGNVLVKSGYFADVREASQAMVKIMAGQELGIGPIQSMMGLYIVKGRVSQSANIMAALLKRSGRYDFRVLEHTNEKCVIRFFDGKEPIGDSSFTLEDATAAGLLANETWKKFRRNMLWARAMSNGCRWYCPEVLGGVIYTPEELGAKVDDMGDMIEGEIVQPKPSPEQLQTAVETSRAAAVEREKSAKKGKLSPEMQQGLTEKAKVAFTDPDKAKNKADYTALVKHVCNCAPAELTAEDFPALVIALDGVIAEKAAASAEFQDDTHYKADEQALPLEGPGEEITDPFADQ